jgi:TPR repeat protein
MKFTFKHIVAAILLTASFVAASFVAPAAAGPLEDATTAYSKGDYATAFRLLRRLADLGMPKAQTLLGVMYARGQGVAQNNAEASWLLTKATLRRRRLWELCMPTV